MGQNIPIGIYAFNPNGNDPVAEAAFESTVADFTSTVEVAPRYIDAFVDDSSWSGMVGSAQWVAWSQSQSPVAKSMHPVVAVPLGTSSDNGIGTLQQIAAGAHDDVYAGMAEAYRDKGFTSIDMRIGWEMDGNYMPWSMGNTPASVAAWVAAFSHVADVLHAVPGIQVNVVWNPGLTNNSQVPVANAYPGDSKVDIIGLDIYSPTYKYDPSVSDSQFYNYPAASQYHSTGDDSVQWGLAQTMSFAAQHGKPVGIEETGIATGGSTALPQTIASDFNAPGAPTAAYVNIWDVPTGQGNWQFTGGINAAAGQAWAAALGSGQTGAATQGSGATSPASGGAGTAPANPQPVSPPSASPPSANVAPANPAPINTVPINLVTLPNAGPVQFLTAGANRAEAAWGAMDISGDPGADLYVVHPGDATLIIENFAAGKGDVLNISSSLQGSLAETQAANAVVLSFNNDPSGTGSVYLKGVTAFDPSMIHWS